ncbi:hypothetical protein [Marinovum sp.]|uniref:hypothetical protein n=1 Tax=Marinovum sp. TaxID=2024839 RepID=UPI003A915A51
MELNWETVWYESKAWIEGELGMSSDLLHVQIGLAVFLACVLLLRTRRNGVLIAWCLVAGLQTVNEAFDARDWIIWTGSVNWPETAKDCSLTLFWPTIFLVTWRWTGRVQMPDAAQGRPRRRSA